MTDDRNGLRNVLVTYGRHPKTLAVVRSLGRSGREVTVTDDIGWSIAALSRHCTRQEMLPSPIAQPRAYLKELIELVDRWHVDIVIPMDDPECDLMNEFVKCGRLGAKLALMTGDSYCIARSKFRTQQLAHKLGIDAPKTILLEDGSSVSAIGEQIGFPAVIKPAKGSGSRGFRIVQKGFSSEDLSSLINRTGPVVAQEFVPNGGSIGVSYLFDHGTMKVFFTHRRLMEFPETGGPSTVRESTRNPEAEGIGRLLLEELKWHGVAMVEFKIDARTAKPKLIEINPRFWGSLQLAVASGVDFPRLLCDLHEGRDMPTMTPYRLNVRCVNLLPHGIASLAARGGFKRSVALLQQCLNSRCYDVESFSDPKPTIAAILSLARYAASEEMVDKFYSR
jgi:predicted ATP-grasp superfamily ATP-dependent carboligase